DSSCALYQTGLHVEPQGRRWRIGDVRSARFYSLLAAKPSRSGMGDRAKDGQESFDTSDSKGGGVVPGQPAPQGRRSASGTRSEAARSLPVLRDHREWSCAAQLLRSGASRVATLAEPSIATQQHDMGTVRADAATVCAASAQNRSRVRRAAKP